MIWPCRTWLPDFEAIGIARHVAIGGLVAVDVLDLDLVAIAGLPLVVLDDAIAGGIDRRARGRGEIDAGMQLAGVENGVDAIAEARPQSCRRLRAAGG